jgi:hypothetical protein
LNNVDFPTFGRPTIPSFSIGEKYSWSYESFRLAPNGA